MTAAIPKTGKVSKAISFRPDEGSKPRRKKTVVPAVNIDETETEYILTLAAPGFARGALQVKIEKDILSIDAAKEVQNRQFIHDCCEYDFTNWKREFVLPDDADGLMTRAKYLNGELIIRIPRGKKGSSPFIIPIYVY